ncbi:MAG: hypothetical protein ACR2O4_13255 [Hyphomicrobiaceae bacterium]
MNGEEAYRLVCAYAAIEGHRTGTPGDQKTLRWLGQELSRRGADVVLENFPCRHFEADVIVRHDDRLVDAMAFHDAAVGQYELGHLAVGSIDAHAADAVLKAEIFSRVEKARRCSHDGLVLATRCPTGALCAINRPSGSHIDFPVVLVPGHEHAALREGMISIAYSAVSRNSKAENLLAEFPAPAGGPTIVITTPVSGWFSCAGERGCGIAVAIHLAELLSKQFSVHLLLASGHELGFLGGYHLANTFRQRPGCIVHLGSCIANIGADLMAVCSAAGTTFNVIAGALAPLQIVPVAPAHPARADEWVGESACWVAHERPMLSIAGMAPHFHTSADVPEAATTPELLQAALDAIGAAALELAGNCQ